MKDYLLGRKPFVSFLVSRNLILAFFLCLALSFVSTGFLKAQEKLYEESYLLPSEQVQELLTRDRHYDMLNMLSPDGDHFLIPIREQYSTLKRMAQKTYRLAMLEFCPDVNREWRLSTYGIKGLKIYSLKQRKTWNIRIPENILVSDMTWSPEGEKIAFLAHLEEGTQVWTADVETGETTPVSNAYVMATLAARPQWGRSSSDSRMLQWTADGGILTLLVPSDRGPEPQKKNIPGSPIIRRTREKPTPTQTYPFLLRTPHDKELFRYYTTSQLALLVPGESPMKIGEPAMYLEISLSPDGKYILAEKLTEPFSYIVSFSDFPRELQVLDFEGKILSLIRKVPLKEAMSRDRSQGVERDLPRDVAWRPDGRGLAFLWREKKKKEKNNNEEIEGKQKDRIILLPPPFDMDKVITLVSSEKSFSQASYSPKGRYAFARLTGKNEAGKNRQEIIVYDLSKKPAKPYVLVKDIDPEDIVKLPGDIITKRTGNGIVCALLSTDKRSVYLQGPGYSESFKRQPFIDRVAIASGKKQRIFESSSEMFEQPLVPLNNNLNSMIISRESKTVFPDCYLWSKKKSAEKLTNNKNPFPEFTACRSEEFTFSRRDGLLIHGRITLPLDYKEGTRVPAVFWTYPREFQSFKDYKKAAMRSRNHNAFQHFQNRNASHIWLAHGYAVVVPDIPIIGKGNQFNNNYIAHLVDSMYAAIRKVDEMGYVDIDRLGHGGHSYGAFATANVLTRTPFFKAGIAGDGAYNRTLTPMSFQRERRFIWEAQDIYIEMSPFFEADHLETPLLMFHGAEDNNSGTFLIQSERMIQALTGLGKKAVLYIYPFESHGPRCVETYMDLWARWLEWFDTYVKKSGEEVKKQ